MLYPGDQNAISLSGGMATTTTTLLLERVQKKQHEQQQPISKKMEKIITINHLLCKLLESSPRPFKIQRQVLIFSKDFREESAQRNDNRKKETLLIFAF